jgi:5'-3' exonuclease
MFSHWIFHYLKDIGDVKSYDIKFDLSKPFLPLQQLLSVLPTASRQLLPLPYQRLMVDSNSPLTKFFPLEFSIDRDGKKNPWEGVALIPFIDEKILLEVISRFKSLQFLFILLSKFRFFHFLNVFFTGNGQN